MGRELVAQSMNYGMNTVMTHKAFGKHAGESLQGVRAEADRLEELLSRFRSGSEISRLNEAAGRSCVSLSSDTYEVLSRAVEFSELCQGLFDVTIGPLVSLWRGCKDTGRPPAEAGIRQVLPLVDYTDLVLDPGRKTAGLRRIGQSVDLGGIGKGFAGDKFVQVFKNCRVTSAFTNIGGNVVALGTKPDGSRWRVGIQHPRQEDCLIGVLAVADQAVVTSGDYQRFFIGSSGQRYHHLLDRASGYPAEAGLTSVTVAADGSMAADALSTILFVAGLNKGLELLKRYSKAEAIFVDMDLRVHVTSGLKDCFQAAEGLNVSILD